MTETVVELIERLCPDGVEHRPMGEVGTFTRGGGPQKKHFRDTGMPCIHYGQIYTHYGLSTQETLSFVPEEVFSKAGKAYPGDVVIAVTGENDEDLAHGVAWLGETPVAVSNHTLIYSTEMDAKFVSYFLRSKGFESQKRIWISGTKVRALSTKGMSQILIPVPPLEIQQEVVRVLEEYSDLQQRLEVQLHSELEDRQTQYELCRMSIMQIDEPADTVPLEQLGQWRGGGTPSKRRRDFWEGGEIPWVSPKDMKPFYIDDSQDHITETAIEGSSTRLVQENAVLFVTRSSILSHTFPVCINRVPVALNQDLKAISLVEGVLAEYVSYYLLTFADDVLKRTRKQGGSVTSLNTDPLKKYEIPIPNLDVQRRIVTQIQELQESFDSLKLELTNEISFRRQQYEYYRDQLLAFTKESVAS